MKWVELVENIEINLPLLWKKTGDIDSFTEQLAKYLAHETLHLIFPELETGVPVVKEEIAIRTLLEQEVNIPFIKSVYDDYDNLSND